MRDVMGRFGEVTSKTISSLLASLVIHSILILIGYLLLPKPADVFTGDALPVELLKVRKRPLRRRFIRKEIVLPRQQVEEGLKHPPTFTSKAVFDSVESYIRVERVSVNTGVVPPNGCVTEGISPESYRFKIGETVSVENFYQPIELKLSPLDLSPATSELPGLTSFLEPAAPVDLFAESLGEFLRKVRRKIEEAKLFPEAAREAGYEGTVVVSFEILRDGSLGRIEVLKSSGYEVLDKAAVETIRRASPFPKPPLYGRGEALRVEVPITFKITSTLDR